MVDSDRSSLMTQAICQKQRRFPKATSLFWLVILCVALRLIYYVVSDGFALYKIENTFPVTEAWQISAPNEAELARIHDICKQPFHYLGKGSQVYAFESADGKYVLKLFKCYHLTPVQWLARLPLPGELAHARDEAVERRQKKIDESLASYKIAADSLRDECGLIYMQILPSSQFHLPVQLIDKLGRDLSIDLAQFGFILQYKAELIFPKLASWLAAGDQASARSALESIVALIVKRSKKGIQDQDPDLHKNAGLIGTSAIFIDLGSFHRNLQVCHEEVYRRDLVKISRRLRDWLQRAHPELVPALDECIKSASTCTWKKPEA